LSTDSAGKYLSVSCLNFGSENIHPQAVHFTRAVSDIDWLRSHLGPCARRYEGKPKFKYLLPLDEIGERIKPLTKAYLQKCATSETSDTPGVHQSRRTELMEKDASMQREELTHHHREQDKP
jgi:hypothetical protein